MRRVLQKIAVPYATYSNRMIKYSTSKCCPTMKELMSSGRSIVLICHWGQLMVDELILSWIACCWRNTWLSLSFKWFDSKIVICYYDIKWSSTNISYSHLKCNMQLTTGFSFFIHILSKSFLSINIYCPCRYQLYSYLSSSLSQAAFFSIINGTTDILTARPITITSLQPTLSGYAHETSKLNRMKEGPEY